MQTAKRVLIASLVLVVLALDYAALDDITTGNQLDFTVEWTWLAFSSVFLGALGCVLVYRRRNRRPPGDTRPS